MLMKGRNINDMAEKKKRQNFDFDSFYTSPEMAGKEALKRFANKSLRKEIESFLKNDLPEPLLKSPKAVLGRNIFTPNREFFLFLNEAKKTGLDIFLGEYKEDEFISGNLDKYYLGKLFFYNKKGKNGGDRLTTSRIIKFSDSEKKKIIDVKTLWGEPLVDFHNRIFFETVPSSIAEKRYDMSNWFQRHGKSAKKYYTFCFSLFIAHGILFENYLLSDNDEERFFYEVLLPSIETVKKLFGHAPLISPLCKEEKLDDFSDRWMHYPEYIKKMVPIIAK